MRLQTLLSCLVIAGFGFTGCDDDDNDDSPIILVDSGTSSPGQHKDAGLASPACSDGIDNDGDGLTDFPNDPGCKSADDDDEGNPPQCNDGIDNDEDGLIDFPADPGCGSIYDDNEYNALVAPQCSDGIDNDRDGYVDEEDPGCKTSTDDSEVDEATVPACSDGIDNDNDGYTDFPYDPGCMTAGGDSEVDPTTKPECSDGIDNDNDGYTDFPNDPGCSGRGDKTEQDKLVTPECSDGIDNDLDGKTDYPEDDGCMSAADYSEKGSCGDTYTPPLLESGVAIRLNTSTGLFSSKGSCGGDGSPERVVQFRVTEECDRLDITTGGETAVPTTLYVRKTSCLNSGAEIACQREATSGPFGHTLSIPEPSLGDYFIFVDGVAGGGGIVDLTVTAVPRPACQNGKDDDGNGRIDYPDDPGCTDPMDRTEETPDVLPVCSNDEDDDGDGLIDYPLDPGCLSAAWEDENEACGTGVHPLEYFFGQEYVMGDTSSAQASNVLSSTCGGTNKNEIIYAYRNPYNARLVLNTAHPETTTSTVLYVRKECDSRASELRCDNGQASGGSSARIALDSVAPGLYWFVVDTRIGAGGPFKLTVESTRVDPACSNDTDDDGDGLIDGFDPGCSSQSDNDETDVPNGGLTQCSDNIDNDLDGYLDFPYDPGCESKGDNSEATPNTLPQCSDGIDNDGNGLIDFPNDPGCESRGDNTERAPYPMPQCSDGIDNDLDGYIDYPNDPQCISAGSWSESLH